MNFNINEKVICINNDDVEDLLEKGKEYIIDGLKKGCCVPIIVSVGLRSENCIELECLNCHAITINDEHRWFKSSRFARIESIPESHEKEVEKLIEESISVEK